MDSVTHIMRLSVWQQCRKQRSQSRETQLRKRQAEKTKRNWCRKRCKVCVQFGISCSVLNKPYRLAQQRERDRNRCATCIAEERCVTMESSKNFTENMLRRRKEQHRLRRKRDARLRAKDKTLRSVRNIMQFPQLLVLC